MAAFDLSGALRRIRRTADLSQRELAQACGLSQSAVAQAETGRRDLAVSALATAAELAGLRLALLTATDEEVQGMAADTVRDLGGRRFAAHLDTRHAYREPWSYEPRRDRPEHWYTFDRDRAGRDSRRRHDGTPADHLLPQPGDSPREWAAERRRAAARFRAEARRRRFLSGEFRDLPEPFECDCPPACDELDDRSGRPVHAEECPCSCDLA